MHGALHKLDSVTETWKERYFELVVEDLACQLVQFRGDGGGGRAVGVLPIRRVSGFSDERRDGAWILRVIGSGIGSDGVEHKRIWTLRCRDAGNLRAWLAAINGAITGNSNNTNRHGNLSPLSPLPRSPSPFASPATSPLPVQSSKNNYSRAPTYSATTALDSPMSLPSFRSLSASPFAPATPTTVANDDFGDPRDRLSSESDRDSERAFPTRPSANPLLRPTSIPIRTNLSRQSSLSKVIYPLPSSPHSSTTTHARNLHASILSRQQHQLQPFLSQQIPNSNLSDISRRANSFDSINPKIPTKQDPKSLKKK
ncbi:hypothetical protein HK100_008008, partial [Physocladia obscura]